MVNDKIVIRGAREHNLKDVNLTIPKDKLVVITGLSGSGKSSLASNHCQATPDNFWDKWISRMLIQSMA